MRAVLLHGHIFKNAGSTFDWSLRRSFGEGFLDHRDDKTMRERGAKHLLGLLRENPQLRALSSHCLCQPLPAATDLEFIPVYFLRHPLERIASVYAFERQQEADTPGARAAKELDFTGYVAWRMQARVSRTIRDYQTCNIAGQHEMDCIPRVDFGVLKTALEHFSSLQCVGVVDRYDESMVVLEYLLEEQFPSLDLAYLRQNASSAQPPEAGLENRVRAVLRDLGELQAQVLGNNSFDLALYRLANQRLDENVADVPGFERRLQEFRQRCRELREDGA